MFKKTSPQLQRAPTDPFAERQGRHVGNVEIRDWQHETQTRYILDQPLSCPKNRNHFIHTGLAAQVLSL